MDDVKNDGRTSFASNHIKSDKSDKTIPINNIDFLKRIFGNTPSNEQPIILSFKGSPLKVAKQKWFGKPWALQVTIRGRQT